MLNDYYFLIAGPFNKISPGEDSEIRELIRTQISNKEGEEPKVIFSGFGISEKCKTLLLYIMQNYPAE